MNASATGILPETATPDVSPAAVKAKLYNLTYKNACALAAKLGNGSIGISPLVKWTKGNANNPTGRPITHCFSDWLLDRYGSAAIAAQIDGYVERSRKAREYVQARNPAGAPVRNVPIPPPAIPPSPTRSAEEVRQAEDEAAAYATDQPEADTPDDEPVYAAGSIEATIQAIVRATMERHATRAQVSPAQVLDIVKPMIDAAIERAKLPRVVTVQVTNPEGVTVNVGRQHKTFPRLLSRCALRRNVWLSGPAGSGKTTGAMKVAEALSLPFYFTGSIDTEYKLLGFRDAAGNVARTAFREAWENGGVFLFDECDGSAASALLALNAALANGSCAFPDGIVPRHKDCIIIAAANTWGNGATFEYVGRTKLDAASMDRFIRMAWDYDNDLVRDTCGNPVWADKVVRFRANAASIKGHIISPRAAYNGAAMLAAGIPEAEVIEELITPGLSADQRRTVMRMGY